LNFLLNDASGTKSSKILQNAKVAMTGKQWQKQVSRKTRNCCEMVQERYQNEKEKNDTNFMWQTTLSRKRIWIEFRREAPAAVILTSVKQVGMENN
jgi:hypothetical protein